MALKSNNTAIAVAIQPSDNVFQAPVQPADLMPISNCQLNIQSVTIENDEYTGSPIRNAADVAGKRASVSFNVKARPPAGGIPAANAFNLGKILQSAKLTEVINAAAIPAAPEALGGGSTSRIAVLGATAAAVADTYKAFPLLLSDQGATYKEQLTAIRSYDGTKNAGLMEELAAAPAANYQIPAFVGYFRDVTSADPIQLSFYLWLDGRRFSLKNARPSSFRATFPTSTKDQAQYPEFEVTYEVDIEDAATEEATPAVPGLGATPLYKDGKSRLDYTPMCTSTFSVDLGIQTENPPCPNAEDGSDPAELVGSTASVSMTRHMYLPSVLDTLALADAQDQHPFMAQYGTGAGKMVQVIVPDARLDYGSPDLGGSFILENGDLMIDALDRGVAFIFPA